MHTQIVFLNKSGNTKLSHLEKYEFKNAVFHSSSFSHIQTFNNL